jgi:hypothetical protein
MNPGAIATIIVFWVIFIGSFSFFFAKLGKGGKWED